METLIYQLKSIRLSGMSQKLNIRIQEATANEISHLDFLRNLVEDELTIRKDRLLNRRLKQAQFSFLKTFDDFDFGFNPSINKSLIKQLGTSGFVANKENILLIGPPGVGKTHLAIACGMNAIYNGFAVLYRSVFDISKEVIESNEQKIMETYLKPNLLIIDELGMKKLSSYTTEILLEIIHRRYQKSSTIIATNRPIEDWGKVFGDNAAASAILDRFLENINFIKITGRSYRLRNLNKNQQKNIDSKG